MSNTAPASLALPRHHQTVFSTLTVLLLSLVLLTACSGGSGSDTGSGTVTPIPAPTPTPTTFTLSITNTGTGGTITSSPSGITCGTTCSSTYTNNTNVTLTAATSTGYTFTGWSGSGITCSGTGPCTVTMSAARTVSASFTQNSPSNYTLTLSKVGTGTITSAPAGINCGTTCSGPFASGTTLGLTAIPGSGYTFSGWGGACSSSAMAATCPLLITANLNVSALFTAVVPATGTATVSWTAPTTREDGSPMAISELAGYRIYYGTSPTNTNIVVDITGGSTTERAITGLAPGTYYFKVSAYDTAGVEGPKSGVVSKLIP